MSDIPLRNEDGELISGELEADQNGFSPAAPLTDVQMPAAADGTVRLTDVGVGFSFPASDGTAGRLVDAASGSDNEMVFYPNTQTDTDTAITYTLQGVETFNYLRSEDSPERIQIQYEIPAGASLESTQDGGAVILDEEGELLATVFQPFAFDAQGTDVPMTLTVQGDSIVLEVPHRDRDFAYPIMVDPVTHTWDWWTNGAIGTDGWQFYEEGSTNYTSNTTCPPSVPSSDPCKTGTGAGVYVSMVPGSSYPAGSKAYWRWTVPGGADSYIDSANLTSWRYREGPDTWGWAFYNVYNGGGSNQTQSANGGSLPLAGGTTSDYIHVGLMTNTTFVMPTGSANWRYNRLAAYTASLNDLYAPSLSLSGAPTGWMGPNTNFNVTANSQDTGLGLGWIKATVNGTVVNQWAGWCTGTYPYRCPNSMVSQSMAFNSNSLPNGFGSAPS